MVGLAGNAIARRFRRSPLPFIVPGSLMLVPGSVGYESASSLLAGQTVSGIDTAFNTVVMLLAIGYGLVASDPRPAGSASDAWRGWTLMVVWTQGGAFLTNARCPSPMPRGT